jgi:dTDP-glucose 4,6-dehydratase
VSLGNLEPLRDLTYVEDTVEGFIEIAQHTEAIGQVINIGSGQEISIGDLAKTILKLMGKDIPVIRDKQRIRPRGSEVERLCADTRKAQQLLGWSPSNSLKQGLMKTIEWIQLNYERYQADTYII